MGGVVRENRAAHRCFPTSALSLKAPLFMQNTGSKAHEVDIYAICASV